jgi:hypothetical protein
LYFERGKMATNDLSSEFRGKAFLMYLPPRGKNHLSVNGRLVFSYLFYRRKFKKGSSLVKIADFLGMAAHHGVKSAITELKDQKLVAPGKDFRWFAVEERPTIFASKGFIPVYMLRESKGGRLTNTDNVMLWVLRYLQLPGARWKWPRNRSAVLANFVGIKPRNVKRHINKLQGMNLVTEDWHVNSFVIDPDWYRFPKDDDPAETYVPMPETGNRFVDEVLNSVSLSAGLRGMEQLAVAQLLRGLIRSGCLDDIRDGLRARRVVDCLRRCATLDLPTITAAIETALSKQRVARQASPESDDPPTPVVQELTPVVLGEEGGETFGVLDLEALSLGMDEDFDFLAEGLTDDMVATSTI